MMDVPHKNALLIALGVITGAVRINAVSWSLLTAAKPHSATWEEAAYSSIGPAHCVAVIADRLTHQGEFAAMNQPAEPTA
jgi:hypothetical protein